MTRAIKWILVLMVIAGGGWLVWYSGWLTQSPQSLATTAPIATTTPEATPVQENMNGMTDAKDASDSALMQDAAAINTQLQGLGADISSLSSTTNDKPTPQATNL